MALNFKDLIAINGKKGGWVPPPIPKGYDLSSRRPSAPEKPPSEPQSARAATRKEVVFAAASPRDEPVQPPKVNKEKDDFEKTVLLKLFERHKIKAEDIIKRKIMFDRLLQNEETSQFLKTKILESMCDTLNDQSRLMRRIRKDFDDYMTQADLQAKNAAHYSAASPVRSNLSTKNNSSPVSPPPTGQDSMNDFLKNFLAIRDTKKQTRDIALKTSHISSEMYDFINHRTDVRTSNIPDDDAIRLLRIENKVFEEKLVKFKNLYNTIRVYIEDAKDVKEFLQIEINNKERQKEMATKQIGDIQSSLAKLSSQKPSSQPGSARSSFIGNLPFTTKNANKKDVSFASERPSSLNASMASERGDPLNSSNYYGYAPQHRETLQTEVGPSLATSKASTTRSTANLFNGIKNLFTKSDKKKTERGNSFECHTTYGSSSRVETQPPLDFPSRRQKKSPAMYRASLPFIPH
eukprot:TRINITY_DN6522_c0_g1_i4.p1 TRINITY_DN6522_c0_g1~~TRINITY_DN6522_c0_g1_i4.p1  ORF type:complete len:464 (-),score=95.93 TRINITY_DN6522_c0_g1_i4:493-1884(-)